MEFRWNIVTIINTFLKYGIIIMGLGMLRSNSITLGELVMLVSLFDQSSVSCLGKGRRFTSAYRYMKDFKRICLKLTLEERHQ